MYVAKVLSGREGLGNSWQPSHQIRAAVFGSEGLGQTLLYCEEAGVGKTVIAWRFIVKKLDGQRRECLCMPMVDIGTFKACTHNFIYCYANGFYSYRGKLKSLLDKVEGEVYNRKIKKSFGISKNKHK